MAFVPRVVICIGFSILCQSGLPLPPGFSLQHRHFAKGVLYVSRGPLRLKKFHAIQITRNFVQGGMRCLTVRLTTTPRRPLGILP